MSSDIYRLFVYGSLRSGSFNAVYTHISRNFEFDGMGSVQGLLYDMGEYPGAVPTTDEHFITGEVYHIAQAEDFEWAIHFLDEYEGLIVPAGEVPLFRREPATVLFRNATVTAWMYWYNRPVKDKYRIESGDWVAYKMGIGK